jgi:hypothetical protein
MNPKQPTGSHLRPGFGHQIVALRIVEIIVAVKCASRDAIRSSAIGRPEDRMTSDFANPNALAGG